MSDAIDTAVRGLRGQQPPGGFASAGAVRRRGTLRTYRQMLTAGVAVLAVAGGVVTWAGPWTERQGPPATSGASSAGPSVVLAPAMFLTAADLTAADLPAGEWVIGQAGDGGRDLWLWEDICQPFRRADYPSLAKRAQMDWRDFHRTDGPGSGFQMIERYEPGVGRRNFDDVRARLRDCAGMQSTDPAIGNLPLRWTLVANGFAGDGAVLAKRAVFPQDGLVEIGYQVAVRVGDLVSTVRLEPPISEAAARDIAVRAAARLR